LRHDYPGWYQTSNRSEAAADAWPDGFDPQQNPVFAHNETFIPGVSPEQVFAVLVKASAWPDLYDNASDVEVKSGAGEGSVLQMGTQFDWTTFATRTESEVRLYVPNHSIGWIAHNSGGEALHRFIVVPEGDGTRVITEECQRGAAAFLDSGMMAPALHAAHQLWLEELKQSLSSSSATSTATR
jgi:hypothetical protein